MILFLRVDMVGVLPMGEELIVWLLEKELSWILAGM
jgi:hypothetical protein